MDVVRYYCGDDSLAVRILFVLVVLVGRKHLWPAVVGMFSGFMGKDIGGGFSRQSLCVRLRYV
jgi:hypothetical protein